MLPGDICSLRSFCPPASSVLVTTTSPGFDRPLRTAAHFERFAGSEARIELAAPLEGRRRFRGRLGAVADGLVTIEVDRKEWKLPLSGISKARLVG